MHLGVLFCSDLKLLNEMFDDVCLVNDDGLLSEDLALGHILY